jgi:hypothetical protein
MEPTPYLAWAAGQLSDRAAAEAIARELIEVIEPQEKQLQLYKATRRDELGTLLIRIGEPLPVNNRIARWVEPSAIESVSVKQLRALIADLRDQGSSELDGLAMRIEACITTSARRGYLLIEAAGRQR